MTQYILKRILLMIPTIVGILAISFLIIHLAPGDPASHKFGGAGQGSSGVDAQRGTEAAEKKFRERYHLDDPLPVQFVLFLKRLFTLDLEYLLKGGPILDDLLDAMSVSIVLNLIVFGLIYVSAVPIGILSATYPNSLADRVSTIGLFVLYSLPSFWAATLLQLYLCDKSSLIWFPVSGLHTTGMDTPADVGFWPWLLDTSHHVVLPILCLTYGGLAYLSRQMRAGMLEVIRQDYIRTAEAKGAGKSRVILIHALRNGLFPVITLFASLLPFLVSGSVIIETIFNIPGMGRFAFNAVLQREYDVVMATLTISAVLTLGGILVADVLYVIVNPQVSFEDRKG